MKKFPAIIFFLILVVSIMLTSCGKSEDSSSQAQSGSSNNTSSTTPASNNKGEVKYGENLSWPDSNMGNLAKPDAKITGVVKDANTGGCAVTFNEMEKDKADAYIAKLKELGYSGGLETADSNGVLFTGYDKNGVMVTFAYQISTKDGTISYLPKALDGTTVNSGTGTTSGNASSSTESKAESIDMTDVAPWPADLSGIIPELAGKIIDISKVNNSIEVKLEYVTKADFEAYIGKLKEKGFTVDKDEVTQLQKLEYRAYNAAGDWIEASFSSEDSKKTTAYVNYQKADN